MTYNSNKFPDDDYLFPAVGESSRLLVGCRREDYSASRIARAVEDCDAHLLNLNVTSFDGNEGKFPVVFDLRVSHRSPDGVGRSLERYGYTVLDTKGAAETDESTARRRVDEFLRLLEV